jgi:stage II sporulation protein D
MSVPLEEYVLAAALSEVAPSAQEATSAARVFEVQAIVSRTYAVANLGRHAADGFDVCDTTHCQLVDLSLSRRSRWSNVARTAVTATERRVLLAGYRPARVLYHADCGGFRASASDVWGGGGASYLLGGPDPLPAGKIHLAWRYVVDRERLREVLNTSTRTAVGNRLDTIDVQSRDPSGRARLVLLNGARAPLVRGEDFRAVVTTVLGLRAIRSSRFHVQRKGSTFVFEGQGFGHGVGLCQKGALARAAAGESAEKILTFYFPGAVVRRLSSSPVT